jgi:16S rRNA (guanine966-N2)-methyltransferase
VPRVRANRVRVIAGLWRSRLIEFPSVAGLRPSPDRVRETLFNWLGQDLTGMVCLDLFAGSGALGFEALSRGAASLVMVEKNPVAVKALRQNAQRLGATNLSIVHGDALEFARGARTRFDIIFIDPPYGLGLQKAALAAVDGLLDAGGRVYVESDSVLDALRGWRVLKHARAGRVHFHLLEREPHDQGGVSGNV